MEGNNITIYYQRNNEIRIEDDGRQLEEILRAIKEINKIPPQGKANYMKGDSYYLGRRIRITVNKKDIKIETYERYSGYVHSTTNPLDFKIIDGKLEKATEKP